MGIRLRRGARCVGSLCADRSRAAHVDRSVTRVLYPRTYEVERRIAALGKEVRRELDVVAGAGQLAARVERRLERLSAQHAHHVPACGDRLFDAMEGEFPPQLLLTRHLIE